MSFNYNQLTHEIRFTGELPLKDVVLEVYETVPECALFADEAFFRYCAAKIKIALGNKMQIFGYNLPGGISINADAIQSLGESELEKVTLEETLKHPTWAMGQVVTINSATLMNKGLEVIEAHLLFGIDFKDIEVVVHPQSIVHSMVEFKDGSTIAQASPPDMKGPIAYAISYPDRVSDAMKAIDWKTPQAWSFEPIDNEKFPAVDLARRCGSLGGAVAAMYNAANEVAVAAFMKEEIPFTAIVDTIEETVTKLGGQAQSVVRDIKDVSAIENDARRVAQEALAKR